MASAKPARGERPLSPHLWIWRWHWTMLSSIMHRATGVALYVGAIGLVAWLLLLVSGPQTYYQATAFLDTPIGERLFNIILFLFGIALAYHFANGIRHLFWDVGWGYEPKLAESTAIFVILFSLLVPLAVFGAAQIW